MKKEDIQKMLELVPISLKEANAFVERYHRTIDTIDLLLVINLV